MGIENTNLGKQKDTTAQEKAADEVQKKGMSFFDLQLAALQKIGEETAQSFKEAQKKSRARIGESPEKATLEQNMAALKDSQTQIPDINEQLKKQNEHLQKLKDIDIEKSLGEAVKENASWFANTDDIVSSSLRLMNMRNEKIKMVEDSIQATEKQMSDAMASMYVNAYFIAQKSSKTPQEVTKKTDALALEAFDHLGDNIPETLKNPLREARERALQSEQLKAFDRLYLAGDFAGALHTLGQENESNSPIGLDTHKFSRSEIASAYLASTMANANESKNISYRIAHGSPAEQKLREGYICIAFPGDTAEHAFGFMTMAKKMPDGSLSVSFFDQQGKTPTSQDSLTYQDEYNILPRDIADSATTEAEMEKNFDRVVGKIPSFQKMTEATKTLQKTFMPMQRLFIDAQSGKMPKDFVDTVKGMAGTLQNTNILSIIRANMGDVKKDLEILKKIPIGERGKFEQRIAELEKGYTKMANLLANHTVEDFCDKILIDGFVADDFKSWAIKEGVVMATAIGAAVLVGGLTFFTGGAGLAASAALGAAGGVIGSEAGYVISEYAGADEYGAGFSNKSQFGSYLSDEKVFDSSTGTFRKLEGSEVALSYGKDFAMNFVMTLATLGLGRALNAKLIKWVEASKGKSEVRNAVANLTKRVFDLNPQEVDILKSDEAVQKFLKRTFGEFFEEGGEEAVQSGVKQMDDTLSQVVGLITAMRGNSAIQQTVGGRAIRDGGFSLEGNNLVKTISVQGNAADVSGLSQRVSEAMGAQGYSVKVNEDGAIDCTKSSANAEGGTSVILRFKEIFDEDLSVGAAGAGGGDSDETVSPLPETRLENESVSYPSARESDAVNRIFEGGQMGLGRNNPISLKTNPSSAYRQTGLDQIQDIVQSGFVRPPIGKLMGGHRGEVHWSRGHEKLFYYMKVPVIEVDASKVNDRKKGAVKLADLKAIWIFNEATQQYENVLEGGVVVGSKLEYLRTASAGDSVDIQKAQQGEHQLNVVSSVTDFAREQARRVFPEDTAMQKLYEKSLVGLSILSLEEQSALDTAFQSHEKPLQIHQARLYDTIHFVVPATAKNPEYFVTNMLDGCTAVVIITEMPNGERHVVASHFPPFMKERNILELTALITPEMRASTNKTLLIVKNGKRFTDTNELSNSVKAALGDDTKVSETKYENHGKEGDGALVVEIPKAVSAPIAQSDSRTRRQEKRNDPAWAARVEKNLGVLDTPEGRAKFEESLRAEGILKQDEVLNEDDFKAVLSMHQLGGRGSENLFSKRKIARDRENAITNPEAKAQWKRIYEHALEEGFAGGYALDARGQLVPESVEDTLVRNTVSARYDRNLQETEVLMSDDRVRRDVSQYFRSISGSSSTTLSMLRSGNNSMPDRFEGGWYIESINDDGTYNLRHQTYKNLFKPSTTLETLSACNPQIVHEFSRRVQEQRNTPEEIQAQRILKSVESLAKALGQDVHLPWLKNGLVEVMKIDGRNVTMEITAERRLNLATVFKNYLENIQEILKINPRYVAPEFDADTGERLNFLDKVKNVIGDLNELQTSPRNSPKPPVDSAPAGFINRIKGFIFGSKPAESGNVNAFESEQNQGKMVEVVSQGYLEKNAALFIEKSSTVEITYRGNDGVIFILGKASVINGKLVLVTSSGNRIETSEKDPAIVLGRQLDPRLPPTVSSEHCRVFFNGDQIVIKDLSTNGTHVKVTELVRESDMKDRSSKKDVFEAQGLSPERPVKVSSILDVESKKVMRSLEVHGDPYRGQVLTREIIESVGLGPKEKLSLGNKEFFVSEAYMLDPENGESSRIARLLYCYNEESRTYIVRSIYRSNSQGNWRLLPQYSKDENGEIYHYGKGYDESSVNLPISMFEQISRFSENPINLNTVGVDPEFIFAGSAKAKSPVGDRYVTYHDEVSSVPVSIKGTFETPRYSGTAKQLTEPEQIGFSDPYDAPNFSRIEKAFTVSSGLYGGAVSMEVFVSYNGKYRFTMCRDVRNRVWVGPVETTGDNITQSTGLNAFWINLHDLQTPAFEYASQSYGWGNSSLSNNGYVDMFENYLSRIPLIQKYYRDRGIAMPR